MNVVWIKDEKYFHMKVIRNTNFRSKTEHFAHLNEKYNIFFFFFRKHTEHKSHKMRNKSNNIVLFWYVILVPQKKKEQKGLKNIDQANPIAHKEQLECHQIRWTEKREA